MNWLASDAAMVRRLIVKDWQVYQKQLAGFVAGLLLARGLVGMGTPLLASAGALLLLVLLLVVGSYAIQSSCVVIAVDSEGWNVFAMLALMTLIGPFLYWVSSMQGIREHLQGDVIVWSPQVLGLIGGELAVIGIAILAAGWVHARKASFL